MSIIVAIIALGFIIFFHELGHFIAAKLCGVGVLEFSLGMGPRLVSFLWRNTRYSLKLLPLGGSCAMLGEDSAGSGDFLTAEGEENDSDDSILDYDGVRFLKSELSDKSFQNKPNWQRFIICIAGVLNNFLLAFLLAIVVCHYSGFDVPIILGTEASSEVSYLEIEKGDILKSISYDGKAKRSIHSFRDLYVYLYLNSDDFTKDTEISISYLHAGQLRTGNFHPYYDDSAGKFRLGISFYSGRTMASDVGELFKDAFYELQYNIRVVLDSIRMILKGRVQRNEVMGPVGTVSVIGTTVEQSTQYGLFNAFLVLLELSLMISANLGVMNLLPIPALDGGRLLFILVEMISRRRLNKEWEERINQIGMIFLLLLMMLILSNDIYNLISGAYKELF